MQEVASGARQQWAFVRHVLPGENSPLEAAALDHVPGGVSVGHVQSGSDGGGHVRTPVRDQRLRLVASTTSNADPGT